MSAPIVACVMLANGRPEMVARAERCFEAQTYEKSYMIRYDNHGQKSIGALRNEANAGSAIINPDIICHWDSDDWSHPNRIAEQVALLQASGAECVGYHQMLFWAEHSTYPVSTAEAWLYRASIPNYTIGTSICY